MNIENFYKQIFVPCFALGTAIYLFLKDSILRKKAKSSTIWPNVDGEILSSGIEAKTESSRGQRATSYNVQIFYKYNFEGKDYTGNTLSFGPYISFKREKLYPIISKYQEGNKTKVHVNPDNPYESVLEPGSYNYNVGRWLSFCFAILGIALFWYSNFVKYNLF